MYTQFHECIFVLIFLFEKTLIPFFVAKISQIILLLRCPPFNNTFFDPMFRIFLAASIISFLLEIELPIKTSASGMLGVTKLHKGKISFFKYLIELVVN